MPSFYDKESGNVYNLAGTHRLKSDANKSAKRWRDKGHLCRVIKGKDGRWGVWVGKRK